MVAVWCQSDPHRHGRREKTLETGRRTTKNVGDPADPAERGVWFREASHGFRSNSTTDGSDPDGRRDVMFTDRFDQTLPDQSERK